MPQHTHRQPTPAARIAATVLTPLIATLCACGGGGGSSSDADGKAPIGVAPQVAPSTYQVNPAASWKPRASNTDYFSGSLASVNLGALGSGGPPSAERTVQLQALGSFRYDSAGQLSSATTGMFVDVAGNPVHPSAGTPYVSPSASSDCGQPELGDAIPEDFVIPSATPLKLIVPAGAAELRLSVSDCYYKDNSLSDDPLRVTVTLL